MKTVDSLGRALATDLPPAGQIQSFEPSSSHNKKEADALHLLLFYGAGDEARTRYLHLGKVALYRMSYTRGTREIIPHFSHLSIVLCAFFRFFLSRVFFRCYDISVAVGSVSKGSVSSASVWAGTVVSSGSVGSVEACVGSGSWAGWYLGPASGYAE